MREGIISVCKKGIKSGKISWVNLWRGEKWTLLWKPLQAPRTDIKLKAHVVYEKKERKFNDEQAGFRPCRSTEDQVTYLTLLIEEGFQAKKQTVVVWVDLEKAFDRVWTKGLLLKLLKTNITHKMYNWIKQYIHNRKAKVSLKGKYSRTASFKQGVRQGGVLSPSLFLIFLNDLISTASPNVKAVQYADDLALICSEDSLIIAQNKTTNNSGQTRPVDNRLVYESKCHKNNLHGL